MTGLRVATVVAALIAAAAALHHLALVPSNDMAASRVVPAIALARGFPIYAGPDSGPIIDFMYGPLAAAAFLPAALATTPGTAMAIAALVNVLAFFLPMAWLHRRAGDGGGAALGGFLCFVLLVLRDPGLAFSALTIHADAPALGWGAVACALLAAPGRAPGKGALAGAALAAVLSAWTKQTMAPLGLVLGVVLLVRHGGGVAARFLAWWAGLGLAMSAVCLAVFGPAEVLFNAVTLPSRMPWYREDAGRAASVVFVAGLFARLAWLPAAALAGLGVLAALRSRWRPLAASPAPALAAVALAMAPAAIAGGAKVGGFLNTFSVSTYFLAAALGTGLAAVARDDPRARVALTVLLVALSLPVAAGPDGFAQTRATPEALRAWWDGPQDHAYRAALAHPGELYLPWNPLATLLAENRLDNNEIGAWNRDLAGVTIPDTLWRRHLPPRLRVVAYRPALGAFAWLPAPSGRLPELTRDTTMPGLEGWTILAPDPVAPPSRRVLEPPPDGDEPPRS